MKFTALFVLALFGAVNAGYFSSSSGDKDGHGSSGSGYSAIGSSGLRTIAQGSAHQANSAVAQQHAAARQASYVAKNTLALAAAQASNTAQAAYAGKRALYAVLEEQINRERGSIQGEIDQLHEAELAAAAARSAAQQAQSHVSVLTSALNSAQEVASRTEAASGTTAAVLASQTQMVQRIKARAQALYAQLEAIRVDFAATQQAAEKAALSAQEAQNNASAAAAHAAIELEQSAAHASAHGSSDDDGSYGHEGSYKH